MSKLSRLQEASDFDVKEWIHSELELTKYQQSKFDSETVRLSPFWFYKKQEKKVISPLWRITILIYPIYWCVLIILLPLNFLIIGKWGYGRKFIDQFHNNWKNKIGI